MTNEDIELDILEKYTLPYVHFPQDTLEQKKMLAWHVSRLTAKEMLLASPSAFSYEGIVAGITLEQIAYFAKNAPKNYKKELAGAVAKKYKAEEIFQIARMMDEDLGEAATQNQKRIKSVFQYVSDNWSVFNF